VLCITQKAICLLIRVACTVGILKPYCRPYLYLTLYIKSSNSLVSGTRSKMTVFSMLLLLISMSLSSLIGGGLTVGVDRGIELCIESSIAPK
jgi:hypothetical protein